MTIDGFAVAASNGKKRKVQDFHHLLDPHTGKPVNDIAGVYISAQSCMVADLYSTAVFVSGVEQGKKFLAESDEISGMIVFADGSYWKKEGYRGVLFS
ncbi:FAD:protein FMN transferase [Patescibacteria group bacterium]|nr:FAD:protein FMN transferase [Patescibacteria group bacterium]